MGDDDLAHTAGLFRAMGHPIRLGVLDRLRREGEICACDFTEYFGVSQPTISGHLRTLREAGLVRTRRDGTQICYSLDPAALEVVRRMSALLVSTV
ncbi:MULTISPECIES: ArsR/SmtB family transcription factor [Saccharopolyspora]|uniref:Transcriptional regulator n=1 Tax=Saccharopolyspora elongata TaxID=2530387 RepID=A0A4R4YFZ8_9PSEU|nr:metalloregulator ArsR/SmtB family transcription factor [Saccharopolyspora elongata]TDD43738.1 transcriptional regulator [Saccharopolyspora elongata]